LKKRLNNIATVIKQLRRHLGLSQEKLAAKLGVSFPTIYRWEHNRAKPSPLALQKIEELLKGMGKEGMDLLKQLFPEYQKFPDSISE